MLSSIRLDRNLNVHWRMMCLEKTKTSLWTRDVHHHHSLAGFLGQWHSMWFESNFGFQLLIHQKHWQGNKRHPKEVGSHSVKGWVGCVCLGMCPRSGSDYPDWERHVMITSYQVNKDGPLSARTNWPERTQQSPPAEAGQTNAQTEQCRLRGLKLLNTTFWMYTCHSGFLKWIPEDCNQVFNTQNHLITRHINSGTLKNVLLKKLLVLISAAHTIKLEQYREDWSMAPA